MIDKRHIGTVLPRFSTTVSAQRLRLFAKATGQDDPLYVDEVAAKSAGHPGLPLPPTFLFCLESDSPHAASTRELLGLDYRRLLHGEQGFTYHAMAHVGDTLNFEPRIADIYAKKNGALEFVVRETRVSNQRGQLVAELRTVTVMRHG